MNTISNKKCDSEIGKNRSDYAKRGYGISPSHCKKPSRGRESSTPSVASSATMDPHPHGKIRTLVQDGTFMGGDFVLDYDGRFATCSFCFERSG
jgi:hypothetical protein